MPKDELRLWSVVAVLAVLLAAVAGYKRWSATAHTPVVRAVSVKSCDLNQGPCVMRVDGLGDVWLSVEPRPIPLVKPIKLSVRTSITEISSVDVEFTGVDMDMGYNRFNLVRTAPGYFSGDAMLPVCVRSRMTWQANVILQRADETVISTYRFDTTANH